MTQVALLLLLLTAAYSFIIPSHHCRTSSSVLYATNWDALIAEDEEDDLQFNGPPVARDMKYNIFNINRQRENFEKIKVIAGKDLVNDIYCRDPDDGTTYWYVGKIARISDVSIEKAMARQWSMIEEHSARLRPTELYPNWGKLQLWVAPGESELDVAYCKPDLTFVQMQHEVEGANEVRNVEVGFAGELYEDNEEGFRTRRTDDGKAVKSEIQQQERTPTDGEMDELMEMLNSQVEASEGGSINMK